MSIVNGEGNLSSKLYIIGEAPGATEEQKGRPFCGGSGQVLESLLQEVGIRRDDCYIDNVIQVRPANNNFGIYYKDKKPTPQLEEGHRRIQSLIRANSPNVVALLGNEALLAVTNKNSVMKWRGSILNFEGIKVIPTIHPAAIMREYKFRTPSAFDWARIKEESLSPNFPELPIENYIIKPSYEKIVEVIEFLHKQPYLSFDIETQSNNQITCIGFAWSASDAICIPICYGTYSFFSELEEIEIIRRVKELLENPQINFIAQNVQFDWTFLQDKWKVDVHKMNLFMDTMIAHHCVYPELPKSLAFLTSIYTKRPYYKDIAFEGGDSQALFYYNCNDTTSTFQCAFEIKKEAEEFGTWEFYQKYSNPLIKPLFKMQSRGVKIDVTKREEIDIRLSKELEDLQERLSKAVGHELNANSPKQMTKFLYEELKLPKQFNKEGNLTANEDAIKELSKTFKNPIFNLVLDIRGLRKLLSTYIRAPLDIDGRIRCNYSLTGTETGRLSSRESIYGTGTNLQNIPRGELVRSLFIADEGKILVNSDLSQAEARVVAYLSKEERLQKVFEEGGDIHRKNATRIFKKREEDITTEERELAKAIVHASNYKIGKRKFARLTNLTEKRSEELLLQYFAMFPMIRNWHMETEYKLLKTRTLTTPLGRKRNFFGRWDDELVRSGIAYVPQSTVGDLLNYALVNIYRNLPEGWELLLQNHDAVLLQVPIETPVMHIYKFMNHYMRVPLEINDKRFIIPADIKVGSNWGNLKKLEV